MRDSTSQEPSGPFIRRVLVAIGLTALVVTLLLALWTVRQAVLLAFAGVLLAVILAGAADWLAAETPLPRWAALASVIVTLLVLAGLGVWFLAPLLEDQTQQLLEALPASVDRIQERLGRAAWLRDALGDLRSGLTSAIPAVLSGTFGAVTGLLVSLVVGIYLAADPGTYRSGIIRLVPQAGRQRAAEVLDGVAHALRWFVIGQLAAMLAVGLLTGVGLALLGVPHALTLGIVAGLLEIIPYAGPILAFVPIVLVGFSQGATTGLWVAVLFIGIQQVESNVISPLAQSKAVSLPPAVVILALIAFGSIFGVLGLLLGTPLAAALLVLVRMLYLRDTLGDREEARREGAAL